MRFILVALPALFALLARPCFAAEVHHHDNETEAVDKFYSEWQRPDMRRDDGERYYSCCNRTDCHATVVQKGDGGDLYARSHDGLRWVKIPDELIEQNQTDPRESPDGRNHACISKADEVFCFTYGEGT